MSGGWFWQALGWLALALNVWGNLELTGKTTRGWIVRLACNACWIPYSLATGAWALLANHLLFAAINVYGWRKWTRHRPCPAGECPTCEHARPMGAGGEGDTRRAAPPDSQPVTDPNPAEQRREVRAMATSDAYEVGDDPDEDMAVMYEAAEADLEAARDEIAAARAYATRLEAALVRAHGCPTVRDDGGCDGCFISEVLATCPRGTSGEGP